MKLILRSKEYIVELTSERLDNGLKQKSTIKKKQLPKEVRDRIKLEFSGLKIYEIEEVQHHQKGLFYDVEFKIERKKKDIEFDKNGRILN